MTTVASARNLIQTAELPALEAFQADAPAGGGMPAFDINKDQALVVGADVVSFTIGVEPDFRQALADSSLFAQLVALRKVGANADPMVFFDAYFQTLLGLGWIVQQRDTGQISNDGAGLDVHQAIIGTITAFLSPIAGAAAAVIAVLDGLHQMNKDAPFITLFNKQSTHEHLGRFQLTYVHNDAAMGLVADVMAFALDADSRITQILFFKITSSKVKLSRSNAKLSIDTNALQEIRPNLAAKVKAFRKSLIAEADLGPAPGEN